MKDVERCFFFFFNDTATTEIYTLSLHDALPILQPDHERRLSGEPEAAAGKDARRGVRRLAPRAARRAGTAAGPRSEEHTSELQSRQYLVCRLLLEKKKNYRLYPNIFFFTGLLTI